MTTDSAVFRAICCSANVVLFACGAHSPHPPNTTPAVALRELGAEPRTVLRYDVPPHTSEQTEMHWRVEADAAFTNTVLERGERRVQLPELHATGRVEVASIEPDGGAHVFCAIEVATADPTPSLTARRAAELELEALKNWRASWKLAPDGTISDVIIDPAVGVRRNQLASVVDSIRGASVVFPPQPIGVGAVWQATSSFTASGIAWETKATYILRSLNDHVAVIDVSIASHAPSQALRVEPNSTMRLTSASASVSGTMTIPLNALVPTGEMRGNSEANLLIVDHHTRISSTYRTSHVFRVAPTKLTQQTATSAPTP